MPPRNPHFNHEGPDFGPCPARKIRSPAPLRPRVMHIALVTETYPPEVNGVAMTNQRLVRGLLGLGHRVLLVKPRRADDAEAEAEQPGTEIFGVFGVPIPNYAGLRFGLPAPGQLEHAFEEAHPDLVHVATEGPLGCAALRAARKLGLPVTSTFHTNFHEYCADYGAAALGRATLAYLRWFHNACALTTVPDPDLIHRLDDAGLRRLRRLGRGVDTELFHPDRRDPELRARWGAGRDTPVAIYVGRAAAEKNIPLALRAWAEARKQRPELRMVVVGGGPELKKLRRRWPDVHFAGMRYDADLARHYASGDLFLFGSLSETFGNVVPEALASGLATLTFDYAAGRQFIRDGENGHLVPYGDEAAFTAAAVRLARNPEAWPAVGYRARETAERQPWSATIRTFDALLAEAARCGKTGDKIGIVPATG